MCRFEVIVRDNDGDLAGSKGDFFSIKLSSATAVTSVLDPATVFYARAGYLAGGEPHGQVMLLIILRQLARAQCQLAGLL